MLQEEYREFQQRMKERDDEAKRERQQEAIKAERENMLFQQQTQ